MPKNLHSYSLEKYICQIKIKLGSKEVKTVRTIFSAIRIAYAVHQGRVGGGGRDGDWE